jgi:hypothetical protein
MPVYYSQLFLSIVVACIARFKCKHYINNKGGCKNTLKRGNAQTKPDLMAGDEIIPDF